MVSFFSSIKNCKDISCSEKLGLNLCNNRYTFFECESTLKQSKISSIC